jgi:hypothetical protein
LIVTPEIGPAKGNRRKHYPCFISFSSITEVSS